MVEIARQNNRVSVYQDHRFDGDFRTVKELLAKGVLGKVVRFESAFDRCRPYVRAGAWKERAEPASGMYFDLAPHLVDQTLQLFGPPENVLGDIRIERENSQVEDAFDLTFYFRDGMRAVLGQVCLRQTRGRTIESRERAACM